MDSTARPTDGTLRGWQRRRILVWGKTRPEVSQHYRETVCTGGLFEDTGRLVRLHPIPLRYLDEQRIFKKYQWITADVQRAVDRDRRPESYRIRCDEIEVGETIGTGRAGDWRERASWVLRPTNTARSLEALRAQQAIDQTSLGIVKPKKIVQVHVDTYSPSEQRAFWNKYKAITAQLSLGLNPDEREPKPLTPPDYRFQIRFTCDDPACAIVHKLTVLDWEIDALYFRLKQKYGALRAKDKVVADLEVKTRAPYDLRFFLGNISNYPENFVIVGLWYPKRAAPGLFENEPSEQT